MFVRPTSFQQCVDMLTRALNHTAAERTQYPTHETLSKGLTRALETDWFERAGRPLYDKNEWTRVAYHMLIPEMCKMLMKPAETHKDVAALRATVLKERTAEFTTRMAEVEAACKIHRQRCEVESITPEMVRMRGGMEDMYAEPELRDALLIVYTLNPGRLTCCVFDLMVRKMSHSLREDASIVESHDVPIFRF